MGHRTTSELRSTLSFSYKQADAGPAHCTTASTSQDLQCRVLFRPGLSLLPFLSFHVALRVYQVYECMVRGIAVMRRRADSYVNATQILKVAGVDKGRRTKILEKEILPGKHEIVQGGYGKYQGTWFVKHLTVFPLVQSQYLTWTQRIPLERGRDIALQYGVASILAPLFDFMPSSSSLSSLPNAIQAGSGKPDDCFSDLLPYVLRCTRELFAFYSSLCAYYAWVCLASFKPRTCTRPLHPFNITTSGACISSPAWNRLSRLSGACCSGCFSHTSPSPTTQKDAIRHGFGFFWPPRYNSISNSRPRVCVPTSAILNFLAWYGCGGSRQTIFCCAGLIHH
jgi:hypothetical protein